MTKEELRRQIMIQELLVQKYDRMLEESYLKDKDNIENLLRATMGKSKALEKLEHLKSELLLQTFVDVEHTSAKHIK